MSTKRKSDYSTNDSFTVPDDDEGGSSARRVKRSKKSSETISSHFSTASALSLPKRDKESNLYWELSKARRITISDFKGKKMISVREYYEKDDEWLPGKKGISMTLEQYAGLVSVLPGIEKELRRSGIQDVPRPNYSSVDNVASTAKSESVYALEESDGESAARANHEATSDEGE